jgi:hypothetical protein
MEDNPLKKFWSKCSHSFAKLDHFSSTRKWCTVLKQFSLEKEGVNWLQKRFISFVPGNPRIVEQG